MDDLELTEGLGLDSCTQSCLICLQDPALRFHSIHHQVLEIPSRLFFALLKKKDRKYSTPPPVEKEKMISSEQQYI